MDTEKLLTDMAQARAREVLAHIEFLRTLRQLHARGVTQTMLAKCNRVSQPAVHQMLRRAELEAPDMRPDTHGGTAYEIAVRCAAGEIDRETMRRELIEWVYEKPMAPSAYPDVNDVRPIAEGGFNNQVGRAYGHGFLDEVDYDLILDVLADD